ncbi:MAG TPA: sugar transferase [Anditalea sp.]|nr:sugar transferase [Anditalea sp.]
MGKNFYIFVRRISDIALALLGIIVFTPILVPVMIALKLTGEGHIFYLQERIGYKKKKFHIIKFATMLKNSPNMAGGIITSSGDPRFTPLGPFLRSSKINEIPQLFNILLGEMTLIGPRPVMEQSFEKYSPNIKEIIYNHVPGLTGIGSIIFSHEEELITKVKESGGDAWDFYVNEIYPYKGELEQWYQRNISLGTDFKILLLTAYSVVSRDKRIVYKVFKTLPARKFILDSGKYQIA